MCNYDLLGLITIIIIIIHASIRFIYVLGNIILFSAFIFWGLGWRSSYDTALLFGRPRDRFPVVSLDFSVT